MDTNLWTIIGVVVGLNILLLLLQVLNQFYSESVEIQILSDKCRPEAAKYSYLVLLTFDPKRRHHFNIRGVTLTIDLRDINNRHITRFTISPEVFKNYIFIKLNQSLIKLKLLRINAMPKVQFVKLNHNVFNGMIYIYSLEIQDMQKKISYKAIIDRTIHSFGPTDHSEQNKQTFVCKTEKAEAISEKMTPQHILLSEFVYFVYFTLNLVLLLSVFFASQQLFGKIDDMKATVINGGLSCLLSLVVGTAVLLIYRFDIKVRYTLEIGSKLWHYIRLLYLITICVIGFIFGVLAAMMTWMEYKDRAPKERSTYLFFLFYTWAIGWVALFAIFVLICGLYFLYVLSQSK